LDDSLLAEELCFAVFVNREIHVLQIGAT